MTGYSWAGGQQKQMPHHNSKILHQKIRMIKRLCRPKKYIFQCKSTKPLKQPILL